MYVLSGQALWIQNIFSPIRDVIPVNAIFCWRPKVRKDDSIKHYNPLYISVGIIHGKMLVVYLTALCYHYLCCCAICLITVNSFLRIGWIDDKSSRSKEWTRTVNGKQHTTVTSWRIKHPNLTYTKVCPVQLLIDPVPRKASWKGEC